MQSTHKIPGSSATTWSRYLLTQATRGDYYTHDGQGGKAAPTQWHGPEALLRSYGIDPNKPVELRDLRSLMHGFSPVDGEAIRPAGSDKTRVAGIDMTFSPPKTVSALWATSGPYRRAQIEVAHREAVKSALERTEREVAVVRRKTDRVVRYEKPKRLLAVESVHTTSRLAKDRDTQGIPDPQLHSHVAVIAAVRKDGQVAAVESKQLFRAARENGAWYRAELAENLKSLGLPIERRTGNGERYFEIKGVNTELAEHWSTRSQDVDRAAQTFRQRYGREPQAGELDSLTLGTRGSKSAATPEDVNAAWQALGAEHNQTPQRSEELFNDWGLHNQPKVDLTKELLAEVARDSATVTKRELRAKAYELSAGAARPTDADRLIDDLARSGELLQLEDGTWTTRQLRETEQATLEIAERRTGEHAAPVSEDSLKQARREIGREIKGSLTQEQREALETITGPGGVSVLVGPAGTGKGVTIAAAARAWQLEGNEVIGTAVAGATAQRLQADANLDRSYSADELNHAIQQGRIKIGPNTVIVFDEAAMADHERIAPLIKLTAERGAKPLLVGDAAQLSSIGPGGLFAALQGKVPTAELHEVHRANHEWERNAWQQIRAGEPGPALAQYHAHDRLHIHDTRAQATEAMVENWNQTRRASPDGQAVMITDASNKERDQINAMAQERRAQAGELGAHQVELPGKPYGLRAGDEIIFTAKYPVPGQERIKNGITGTVTDASRDEPRVTIKTNEHEPRDVQIDTGEFSDISLAYAVHVNKGQGLTTETSGILIGGWQTDKEHAYVTVSRAREQTQIYLSREDLGQQGLDTGAIERLAERIGRTRAQEASITKQVAERDQSQAPDRSPTKEATTAEHEPHREHTGEQACPREQEIEDYEPEIEDFLYPRRERTRDKSDDEDFPAPGEPDQAQQDHAQTQEDRVQNDARERVQQHEREPHTTPVNIQHANPADVQLEVRDLGDIKLVYSNGLYDLQAHTGEPTYVLFGGWQTEQQLGFVATVHTHGETDTRMSTEDREGRDIQTELHHRIEQVIERSQSHQASPAREPSTPEAPREPQPTQPEPPAQLEPPDRTPDHEPERAPGREPVERDPYIEQAIQREQERQQAWEQGIDQDRDIDRGY